MKASCLMTSQLYILSSGPKALKWSIWKDALCISSVMNGLRKSLFIWRVIFYFKEFISYINIYQKINKPIYIKKINKIRNSVGSFEQGTSPINAVLPLSRELAFGGKWATCSYFIYIISIFLFMKHFNCLELWSI